MARGRKPIINVNDSDWESVFYNSVGHFVRIINQELSKSYKLEPLSNHIKIIGGYAFKNAQYQNYGVPIIRISDFSNEQIALKDVVYYKEEAILEKYELHENEIVIALTGGTIAKLAIVQSGLGKLYLNQRVGKFKVLNPNEFESEYVYWIARSVQNTIKSLAWGAAIPNVSPKEIEGLQFPFPERSVQQGIIKFLNDLKNNDIQEHVVYFNEEIENCIIALQLTQVEQNTLSKEFSYQLNLVKKLRQQLLQDAVQGKLVQQNPDDEPAKLLLQKITEQKEYLIKDKKFKSENELLQTNPKEIPFEIPKSWVWCRLGDLTKFITSGSRSWKNYYSTKGSLFIRSQNIKSESLEFSKKSYVKLPDKVEGKRTSVLENDILITITGAGVSNSGIINDVFWEEAYVSQHVALIRLVESKLAKWVHLSIISENVGKLQFKDLIYGDKPGLNLAQLNKLLIPLAPFNEQMRIINKLSELLQTCDALEASIKQSQQQNEQLLQQVLREALTKEVEP